MDLHIMRRKKSNPKLPPKYHWEFASCALQGRRGTMEDALCIVKNLGGIENEFFVGIFDGHSGDRYLSYFFFRISFVIEFVIILIFRCSKYISETLPTQLVENASFGKNMELAFQETFTKVDNDWLEICEAKETDNKSNHHSKEKTDTWDDGILSFL